MSRVWKHFLKNLAWPTGFAVYLIAVIIGATYLESLFEGSGLAVVITFVCLPMLAYLVRDMWRDAKEKVEQENRDMMRTLKGK